MALISPMVTLYNTSGPLLLQLGSCIQWRMHVPLYLHRERLQYYCSFFHGTGLLLWYCNSTQWASSRSGMAGVWDHQYLLSVQQSSMVLQAAASSHNGRYQSEHLWPRAYSNEDTPLELVEIYSCWFWLVAHCLPLAAQHRCSLSVWIRVPVP